LTVSFSLVGAATSLALDFDGNGTIDFVGPTIEGQTFTYTQPGIYVPSLTITDPLGNQTIIRAMVQVFDLAALDAFLQAKWRAMKDALRAGDIPAAVAQIVADTRADYQTAFQLITPRLPAIDGILTDITLEEVRDGTARYSATRTDAGLVKIFDVLFALDEDGIWRIEAF